VPGVARGNIEKNRILEKKIPIFKAYVTPMSFIK